MSSSSSEAINTRDLEEIMTVNNEPLLNHDPYQEPEVQEQPCAEVPAKAASNLII